MISRFDNTCFICKKPAKASKDHYDPQSKQSFHWACKYGDETSEAKPDSKADALAAQLGFISSDAPVPAVWFTWRTDAPARESETLSLFEY
jgi:hypothetical protein